MKRILSMLLAVVLSFSFAACVADDSPTKEQGEAAQTQNVKEETFGLNDTAVFSDMKFTATEVKESYGDEFFTPENGNVFVGVKFTVENISDEDVVVSSLLLFEGYADDVKCEYSFAAACAFDEGTLDGDIAPGKKLVGWYALEVPENWSSIELDVQSNWLSDNSAKFIFTK